jgi:nitroreductase
MVLNNQQWQELARSRRSTRDFLATPIEDSLLKQVLNDGVTAPSWSNTRPFMVAVAQGEQRDRISQALVGRLRDSAELPGQGANPDFTHVIPYPEGLNERSQRVGKGIYETLGIDRSDKAARFRFLERNYEFFGAPVALFFFSHRGLDRFGTLDLGLYMQTVMLAAKVNGLGTCAQGYLGNYPDIIKSEFEVSDDYALVCGMSIGYPSDHPINSWQAERLPIEELLVQPKHI